MEYPTRKEVRLQDFDYSQNGAYFVTICANNRCENLAYICRGEALLRPLGIIVEQEIQNLSKRYDITIDKYVIMPNHIHILVNVQRAEQSPAPTVIGNNNNRETKGKPTIGDVVCGLKSITTKIANKQDNIINRKIWQRSFHDHVIRNEKDYQKIWEYIENNPKQWELDQYYTSGQ
ncbi:MAG: transposase [Clostridia bacterium]